MLVDMLVWLYLFTLVACDFFGNIARVGYSFQILKNEYKLACNRYLDGEGKVGIFRDYLCV